MSSIDKMVAECKALVPQISAQELNLQKHIYKIIDCRESEEVELGVIPDSIWLCKAKAELNIEKVITEKKMPIVVYCASGTRSALVGKLFLDLGYEHVKSLVGGIESWKNLGLSVTMLGQSKVNKKRFKAQIVMPEIGVQGQLALQNAKVLIIGAGGLGSPVALYLAAAGVGKIGLADNDFVDESNLQRQIMHSTNRIGLHKVESGFLSIKALNPQTEVIMHKMRVNAANIDHVITQYDIVIDGTDNFQTRYLINQACLKNKIINVHGSVFGFQGQVAVFCSDNGPCYRCLFPEPPDGDLAPNCAEGGVLGAVVGVIGSIVAVEAIKIILGKIYLMNTMICYDGLSGNFEALQINKNTICPSCSIAIEKIFYDLSFEDFQKCEIK